MSKTVRTEAVDHLFEAILTLESKEECYTFFQDVCTINELLSLSQRYEVAKMLREKKTFREGYAEVLQNVLAIMGIKSCFVKGTVNGESHLWNKVCIDDIWYNVDLEQDRDAIFKKGIFRGRVENCLVSDEDFLKTHIPEGINKNFASKTVDVKIVRTSIRKLKNIEYHEIDSVIEKEKRSIKAIITCFIR